MKNNKKAVLLAIAALLTGSFMVRPLSAGSNENLRAQDPFIDLNLTSILNRDASAIPAVSVPAPDFRDAVTDAVRAAAPNPLPNYFQVTPALYRSGQPTQAGISKLKAAGIKTVLKLNSDSPAEDGWAASAGMAFETVPMSNKASPTFEQVDAALAIITDPARQPVLVHCKLGHDRTGAVIGAYRVTVQGWTVAKAAAEAKQLGYSDPAFDDITAYLQGYLQHHQQSAAKN